MAGAKHFLIIHLGEKRLPSQVQDFPLRSNAVYWEIHRKRREISGIKKYS